MLTPGRMLTFSSGLVGPRLDICGRIMHALRWRRRGYFVVRRSERCEDERRKERRAISLTTVTFTALPSALYASSFRGGEMLDGCPCFEGGCIPVASCSAAPTR